MVFNDVNHDTVFGYFKWEYIQSRLLWADFLIQKDLGIQVNSEYVYKIVDEKKWCLTRLKYGV